MVSFGPFSLDPLESELRLNGREVKLRPMALKVLCYLALRAGVVVAKEDLLRNVWEGVHVSRVALKVCVNEIRGALHDDHKRPRYIETVARRGYRFLADGGRIPGTQASAPQPIVVGRENELAELEHALADAGGGHRQFVFIAGEMGVGKTALVDLFLNRVAGSRLARVAHGQCLEQRDGGEPYLAALEAFGNLARWDHDFLRCLATCAPTWLAQMPGLVSADAHEGLMRKVQGMSGTRMLVEIAEALEQASHERTLVLAIEDLHWSDQATLELLAYLAQRRRSAHLMLVATYRPAEIVIRNHPLKQKIRELAAHQLSRQITLELLSESAIAQYLAASLPGQSSNRKLSEQIHRATDGNPLFMVNMLNYFLREGLVRDLGGRWELSAPIEELEVPQSLRGMIERQVERLSRQEQHILEAASVAGESFSSALVATALATDPEKIEEFCEDISSGSPLLDQQGIEHWPDETAAGRYQFRHTLYRTVLYARIPTARRMRFHRRIAARLETAYGSRAVEVASELARHAEGGDDAARAVPHLLAAAQVGVGRSGYRDAIRYLEKGLALCPQVSDQSRRSTLEFELQVALGVAHMTTDGYAAPKVAAAFSRAKALSDELGDRVDLLPAFYGLVSFHLVRGELAVARDLCRQLVALAENRSDPKQVMQARFLQGDVLFWCGEFVEAAHFLESAIAAYDPATCGSLALRYSGDDVGVNSRCYHAACLWMIGQPDRARAAVEDAVHLARELDAPFSVAYALTWRGIVHQMMGEPEACLHGADEARSISNRYGFRFFAAAGDVLGGWAAAKLGRKQKGLDQLRTGIREWHATGAGLARSYLLGLRAQAELEAGHSKAGLSALTQALELVDKTGERFFEPELHRLRGEIVLATGSRGQRERARNSSAEAARCFRHAAKIARERGARSFELRAALRLARLESSQGKPGAEDARLREVYGAFKEGFATPDLSEAERLLKGEATKRGGNPEAAAVTRTSRRRSTSARNDAHVRG